MSFVTEVELTTIHCGRCGGTYAICEKLRAHKAEQRGFWNCPYCQVSWGYGECENDRLKKQLAEASAARARLQSENDQLQAAKLELERKASRVKRGLCPCCNRTFTNLARHMATQHGQSRNLKMTGKEKPKK